MAVGPLFKFLKDRLKMRPLGIMQGRLSPRYDGRYQSFPLPYWQSEFYAAKEFGLDQIEFILDFKDSDKNPLLSEHGLSEISNVINLTKVQVRSICADYFMEAPFHSNHKKQSEKVMLELIKSARRLNVTDIVIPCVDQSSLKSSDDISSFLNSMEKMLPAAEAAGVNLSLETDLAPVPFKSLLKSVSSRNLKVNYDIGNSASLGFNCEEEFECYGEYISDLHVKDRVLKGFSVNLGTGNADFNKVFSLLKQIDYSGLLIMQASRAERYLDDLNRLESQIAFTKKLIREYLPPRNH
jgi:L-ribulose-5-phosphate 3-epimerase